MFRVQIEFVDSPANYSCAAPRTLVTACESLTGSLNPGRTLPSLVACTTYSETVASRRRLFSILLPGFCGWKVGGDDCV